MEINVKKQKPVLITGGCGFVGRHLTKKIVERGDSVWIIDNLFTGKHPDIWLSSFKKKSSGKDGIIRYQKGNQEIVFIEKDAIDFFTDELKGRPRISVPQFGDAYHLASIVGGRTLIDGDPVLVATDFAIDALFFAWITKERDC